jgi:nucleoside-diphosphate-sugar epimerase
MQLIIGAGVIGGQVARLLADSGTPVRLVTRHGSGPEHPNIERVAADAADAATLTRLAARADVVYNCANPRYHEWPQLWPPLSRSILAAAEENNAVLVMAGNLYVYGPVDRPMTEDMPLAAPTVKGKIRVAMWHDALASGLRVTEARASDYIGIRNSVLEMALPALRAGKTARLPMPLDQPHAFTYTGDIARTMVRLGLDERAWGRAWHVPTGAPVTLRDVLRRTARIASLPEPRLAQYPAAMVRLASLWDPMAREFGEMRYQWERPFALDSSLTERTFGLRPTDLDTALAQTLAQGSSSGPGMGAVSVAGS